MDRLSTEGRIPEIARYLRRSLVEAPDFAPARPPAYPIGMIACYFQKLVSCSFPSGKNRRSTTQGFVSRAFVLLGGAVRPLCGFSFFLNNDLFFKLVHPTDPTPAPWEMVFSVTTQESETSTVSWSCLYLLR